MNPVILDPVEYRGVKIIVYSQPGRWLRRWNASDGSAYICGDPFDAFTPERALDKAKRRVDRDAETLDAADALHQARFPDSTPLPREDGYPVRS